MNAFSAEMIKLRRSQAWAVVVLLPLIIAGVGTFNTIASGAELAEGWRTLWLRTVVFYGLFPLALGVAVLASLVWRSEHRGGNWNALMSGPVPSARIVIAKTAVAQAQAGADIIAPSGMIDGMVKTIRQALDRRGFHKVCILSYAAKFSSAFYGPFREAAGSTPQFGNRKSYQMNSANVREALAVARIMGPIVGG